MPLDIICPVCGEHFPSNGSTNYNHHRKLCNTPKKPTNIRISPGYILIAIGTSILSTAAAIYYRGSTSPNLWWLVISGLILAAFGIVDIYEEKKG